jgi:hypothetical protein
MNLQEIQTTFDELAEVYLLPTYRKMDSNLVVGCSGSFKTGIVGNPHKPTFGQPINLNDFDIDYWIESDILYEKFSDKLMPDDKFRKVLKQTRGFEGLRQGQKGFSIKFKPSR